MRRQIKISLIAAVAFASVTYGAVKVYADWTGVSATGNVIFCSKTTATPNQANCMVPVEGTTGLPTTGATSYHALSTATAGGMTINIKNSAALVLGIQVINPTATLADLRVINSASAPTCSSATGVIKNIPIQANTTAAGIVIPLPGGVYAATGLSFCLTGAVSDTDATTPVAGVAINIDYN